MDSQEFKVRGRQMVDYIIQYLEVALHLDLKEQGQYLFTRRLKVGE